MGLIWLVRHGQAAFGAADYDVLSPLGGRQAAALTDRLRRLGRIDRVVHGDLVRQRVTAELALQPLGFEVPIVQDARWNEFDQEALLVRTRPSGEAAVVADEQGRRDKVLLADAIDRATERWVADARGPTPGSFGAFRGGVEEGLADVATAPGTTVVFSSAGVIGAACLDLLGLPDSAWPHLNRVMVNAGVTKLVVGRRGVTLVSFNDHAHLEHDRELVTYR